MKDNRTELQKEFEAQTPTIKGVCKIEYLQTFVSWLHLQVDRARGQELHLASVDSQRELLIAFSDWQYRHPLVLVEKSTWQSDRFLKSNS